MAAVPNIDVATMISNSDNSYVVNTIRRELYNQPDFLPMLMSNWFADKTADKTEDFANSQSNPALPCDAKDQLAVYIGFSAFIHCVDAWNFLARGVGALISNDINSCIHMVYYSELRSIMAILASKGIGVFDKAHIQIDSNGDVWNAAIKDKKNKWRKIGTHYFIELALAEIEKNNSNFIYDIFNHIKYEGLSLNEVVKLAGFNLTSVLNGLPFGNYFAMWSIDLSLKSDRELRNTSSYRPAFQRYAVPHDMFERLSKIWLSLEPMPGSPFHHLDYAIFWETAENLARATGKSRQDFIKTIAQSLSTSSARISNATTPFSKWLLDETKKDGSDHTMCFMDPFPMLARSVLLARLAAGMAHNLMQNFNLDVTSSFLKPNAEKFGIIQPESSVSDMGDFYIDVKDSLNSIDQYVADTSILNNLKSTNPIDLFTISQFERVPLWSFQR
ncbi:MAG: hypothetical protein L6Q59_16380 [Ignavibacteriaceae bacterium]|nr:hypothetical protein [Ignavibacteriaceae bacterium]